MVVQILHAQRKQSALGSILMKILIIHFDNQISDVSALLRTFPTQKFVYLHIKCEVRTVHTQ